ncbi:FAD binding domain-containing protein [Podospora aff. communis PSN243]|uniref:FAD binding domain-containing protein n=1 Tax=Podospora aff. communis PSN243 TaxID=3040156 RepID=A0AAV9G756_9PEZI|nr:FAD binding domain-containing protein [Podospora aff. communis PSN243]
MGLSRVFGSLTSIVGLFALTVPTCANEARISDLPAALERVETNSGLFEFEKLQLTDNVLDKLSKFQLGELSAISFAQLPQHLATRQSNVTQPKCKNYPGDAEWPSDAAWRLFNILLGDRLIKTVPEASLCYPEWGQYSAAACEKLTAGWNNSTLRIENPTSIRSIIFQGMTCMPPNYTAAFLGNKVSCTIGGFPQYSINVTNVAQIQMAVNIARELNLRLVIKNTGHDFGAKSTGGGGLNIWTHYLKDSEYYAEYKTDDYTGPAFKLGAGIQVLDANRLAKERGVTLIGGEGITVGLVGGYIQGGGHSPLTSIYGLAADHVLSIQVVTADGRFVTADATTNSDLFWALRGGGAGTFGVVTSITVKAFPKLKVTTMRYNVTTNANFTHDKFWEMQRAYVDGFEQYADLGYYSYYRIRHVGTEIFHDMTSMVAPNTTEAEFRRTMAPLFAKWEQLGVPYTPIIKEYDNYSDAWYEAFPQEVWTWAMRQASRFFPRDVISDPAKRKTVMDTIRSVFDEGSHILQFNIRNPPGTDAIDNAVNPAWRKVLMFAIMFVTWNVTDSPEFVNQFSRNLTYEWNPRWRALTPGSGTYMSESDYIEPNWQESFHGSKYPRLLAIKKKWDPQGVFYATNAVGSEEWQLGELIMGHLPSQNSRLCRK